MHAERRVCGARAASGVAPLTCATHDPERSRGDSSISVSGTQMSTRSVRHSNSSPSSAGAPSAEPARPRPIILTLLNIRSDSQLDSSPLTHGPPKADTTPVTYLVSGFSRTRKSARMLACPRHLR